MTYYRIYLQGADLTDAAVPVFYKGAEKLLSFCPLSIKLGGGKMITYSELLQTIGILISLIGVILNFIKLYHDIKKK